MGSVSRLNAPPSTILAGGWLVVHMTRSLEVAIEEYSSQHAAIKQLSVLPKSEDRMAVMLRIANKIPRQSSGLSCRFVYIAPLIYCGDALGGDSQET